MLLELSPADIRFMHDRINDKFQNGISINETVEMIASGEKTIHCLPRIRVVKMKDWYYAFDNRRLYVYRVLHYRGLLKTVKVHLAKMNQFQPHKLSTKNNGKSVIVSRDVTLQHCEDEHSWTTITSDAENRRETLNNAFARLSLRDDNIRDDDDSSRDEDDFYYHITKPKQNSTTASWNSHQPKSSNELRRSYLIASNRLERNGSMLSSYDRSQQTSNGVSRLSTQPRVSSHFGSSSSSYGDGRDKIGSVYSSYDRSYPTCNATRGFSTQPKVSSYYGTSSSILKNGQERNGYNASRIGHSTAPDQAKSKRKSDSMCTIL